MDQPIMSHQKRHAHPRMGSQIAKHEPVRVVFAAKASRTLAYSSSINCGVDHNNPSFPSDSSVIIPPSLPINPRLLDMPAMQDKLSQISVSGGSIHVIFHFATSIHQIASVDKLVRESGALTYAKEVLVLELLVSLVKENLNVDDETARQVLINSTEIGELLKPDTVWRSGTSVPQPSFLL
ncbi:hypothetical protein ACJ73_01119 [Blastomyces percursus]|uniref:Restriction of telomere capping protein 4 C-terminal domain-containing protein n=1 Tax=Blastomyces percursus TaxID=1658174 RepID=A0A1J9QG51_9EURO|nr:hypothetical protein ACJ73_01119 [Blastomyces percursus]